jgi:hypothetical protein
VPASSIVETEARRVVIFQRGGAITVLGGNDTLRGEPALPGFAIAVAELFPAIG